MILDKKITIRTNPYNFKHYKNLNYNFKCGDFIVVDLMHLQENSHVKINVCCDLCKKKSFIKYQSYNHSFKKYKFYSCKQCSFIKVRKTMKDLYGFEHALQCKEIKTKQENSCFVLMGQKNPSNVESIKRKKEDTCIKNYGVKNPSQSDIVKGKKQNSCFINFGVNNPLQNSEIFQKQQKSAKKIKFHEKTGLYYRGSYEEHFLNYCFENNIKVEKAKTVKYNFDNKKRVYHPDFFLSDKNLIIEIKSLYTYKANLEKNIAKKNSCIEQGFDFIFIINKNYENFKKINHIYK